MNILENIMEDNGLALPSINESFCLDNLKKLLARKTKEFKDFAIESNNTLIQTENIDALTYNNKYIQEFIFENQLEEMKETNEDCENLFDEHSKKKRENSYLKISEEENSLEESKDDSLIIEADLEGIQRNYEIESKFNESLNNSNGNKNKCDLEIIKENNKDNLEKTDFNINNTTSGNAKYIELIEMFTKMDKKKKNIEEDLNYAIERIRGFKMEENRKKNLINDIMKMKEKSAKNIENFEDELNDVIEKTFIKYNSNESYIRPNQHNNIDGNHNLEILADLKKEYELENKLINKNNIIDIDIQGEINIELLSDKNITQKQKEINEERINNLNKKEDEYNLNKHQHIFINHSSNSNEEVNSLSRNSKNNFEKNNEISIEIKNSSQSNTIQENHFNKSKEINNNSIDTGISININCNGTSRGVFNNEKNSNIKIKCQNESKFSASNKSNNKPEFDKNLNINIHIGKLDDEAEYECQERKKAFLCYNQNDLKIKRDSYTNSKNIMLDQDMINLDFLKSTDFSKRNSQNLRNLIKRNHFKLDNEEVNFKINNDNRVYFNDPNEDLELIKIDLKNKHNDSNNHLNDFENNKKFNPISNIFSKNYLIPSNINFNTSYNKIVNINGSGELLNYPQKFINNDKNVENNEQHIRPVLKTNILKKYSCINNNVKFNRNNSKNINSTNSSVNTPNHFTKYNLSQKDKNNAEPYYEQKSNITNDKEISISKLKLNTPLNLEDEFITSTNPQTNNLLVNDFACSIDDDKIKVIEDLFYKLKEYSNKVPELNNIIETYKDKLNVKNLENNITPNFTNLFNNHLNENNNFYNNPKNFSQKNNFQNENSMEDKVKKINIENMGLNNKKDFVVNKPCSFENNSKNQDTNSYSEKNISIGKDSKKTEEIISHLELKAEKVNYLFILFIIYCLAFRKLF